MLRNSNREREREREREEYWMEQECTSDHDGYRGTGGRDENQTQFYQRLPETLVGMRPFHLSSMSTHSDGRDCALSAGKLYARPVVTKFAVFSDSSHAIQP